MKRGVECVAYRSGDVFVARSVAHRIEHSSGDDLLSAQQGLDRAIRERMLNAPISGFQDGRPLHEQVSLRALAAFASVFSAVRVTEHAHWNIPCPARRG
jgi:hypothetical protein